LFGGRVLTGLGLLGAPHYPKLDLRGRLQRGKGGKEIVLGKGRKGRVEAMKEGTAAKGKRWALADFGGEGTIWPLKLPDVVLFLCIS